MQSMLSILLFLLANTTAGYLAPNPPGKYNVTLTTGPLIDYSRNDPYAATPTPRALMLSVFQPARCASTMPVPDMPVKTAEYQGPFFQKTFNITANLTPLFLEARLPVCSDHPGSCSPLDDVPILLLSPAYSVPRLYYNVIASAIASEGFIVISIDHPRDANIIEYSDGYAVYNNASIPSNPTWDTYPRAADASFIIDQLSNATAMAELLPQRGPRPFPTDRVAMLGHSEGGGAAIVAAHQDPRIRGAINWDGTIFGSPPLSGLSQPVLFMGHDYDPDPTWLEAWPQLKGPKLLVHIANTTHQTFTDVPTLLQAAGQSTVPFGDLLGTIAPAKMMQILTTYTAAWMHGAFRGKEWVPGKFPEVSVTMEGGF
ncbi:PAF acetylhydrolase [Nannizzia gypsea CBS 118893]|uniref:1-alkyl-2-acetylglycerophosphocholine esterase n=1 Tax=Arthroderma gypseum (strain ATCC MYA-4604 / CBS 118893) TaxID=535722 RepID=E4USX0_ARTGP|nr:PAF acetylhydrolase [Nannizzia gypsea CBS 118893]EFR01419.1 PAF acetylhydrolase [Nannizzia gypsea CBS 118893]